MNDVCDCPRAEFNDATLPHGDCGLCVPRAIPPDRNRGAAPTARAWAVARGTAPGGHYALTEQWADQRGRYGTGEIVTRGLTEAEALAHAYALNTAQGGGPGAGERVQSGGTG